MFLCVRMSQPIQPIFMKHTLIFFLLLIRSSPAFSQLYTVSGSVLDSSDKGPMIGVSVVLSATEDSMKLGSISDFEGNFTIENVPAGKYLLKASYLGFTTVQAYLTVNEADLKLQPIILSRSATSLNTVVVAGTQARAEQNGDTTTFNAGAFKTNPDATAEDLLNKMPGVSTNGGTLKVNGEEVKKILVDGKPFFGDDPNAAIKNLPSEIIEKIQVFDRASDQSQFTGFDDGNSEKTINIMTKKGRNNGTFGKVSAGYGFDDKNGSGRYNSGANINFFNGDRRISIVGMANNINQQNFSTDDLLGVSSASGGGGNRGQMGGGSRGGGRGGQGNWGGDPAGNFLVSQQGGITQTQSAGINYSDNWGKKLKVSGSYFFNRAENTSETALTRSYILQDRDSSLVYNEQNVSNSQNINHRFAGRAEWSIDSNNTIFITPRLSFQDNITDKDLNGANIFNGSTRGSNLQNRTNNNTQGYNFSNALLYRHKFGKQGRTLSLNVDTRLNDKTGEGWLYSSNDYIDSLTVTDQRYDLSNTGNTYGGSINYTEPLSRKTQLQFNYSPSFTHNKSDKSTYNAGASGSYESLDSNLTNRFVNDYAYQKGGAGIRYADSLFNFNTSVNVQNANLSSDQSFPRQLSINRTFQNILPQAMLNYKFSRNENLRVFYRTNTNAPSINQLQNVIDNSNPLQLRTGNPDLTQDYTHSLNVRYGKTVSGKGNGIFVFANATVTNNYIGNSTTIREDGVQLSMPVNLNGMYRASGFFTYSLPARKIKSNLNLSAGVNYAQTPSLINNVLNKTQNSALTGGLVLGSNISENVDFTLTYNGAYNIAHNSAQPQSDFNYYTQTSALRFNWIFLKDFVFNTNLTHTLYQGLGEGFDRNFLLWNASIGYKFLKNKALQADLYAFDILNQNNSISRTINDYYAEDTRTTVLQRFVMLRLTYTIRSFRSGDATGNRPEAPADGQSPRGGFRGRDGFGG